MTDAETSYVNSSAYAAFVSAARKPPHPMFDFLSRAGYSIRSPQGDVRLHEPESGIAHNSDLGGLQARLSNRETWFSSWSPSGTELLCCADHVRGDPSEFYAVGGLPTQLAHDFAWALCDRFRSEAAVYPCLVACDFAGETDVDWNALWVGSGALRYHTLEAFGAPDPVFERVSVGPEPQKIGDTHWLWQASTFPTHR